MENSDKVNALLNVFIFTPIAFYVARGKRPPVWLTVASLAVMGVSFVRDINTLMGNQPMPNVINSLLPPPPPANPSLYPKA